MKTLVFLSVCWATAITLGAAFMVAMGWGTPNVVDGESIVGFWMTLWGLSFVSVPLGIFSSIVVAKCLHFACRLAFR